MSIAPSSVSLSTTIAVHDKDDMTRLGTFLLALAKADLDKLGVRGNCKIQFRHQDYIAVFDGGNVLRRTTPRGCILHREVRCPYENCENRSLNNTGEARLCLKHWAEIHGEEKSA